MAVNREELVKYVYYGKAYVSTGPFSGELWYGNPEVKPYPYDPDKAKELLAEAGWQYDDSEKVFKKDGKPFEFELITSTGGSPLLPEFVQDSLEQIGVRMKIRQIEWTVFIKEHVHQHNFDAIMLGWSVGLEPDQYEIWHSGQNKIGQGFNVVNYSNPEADRLLIQGRTEYDREKRIRIYRRLHRIIYDDQPYLFMVATPTYSALHHGEFVIQRKNQEGELVEEAVTMTRIGLLYYLNDWVRRRYAHRTY
jgi:peptide/nickel transport system substrate-binding protein